MSASLILVVAGEREYYSLVHFSENCRHETSFLLKELFKLQLSISSDQILWMPGTESGPNLILVYIKVNI